MNIPKRTNNSQGQVQWHGSYLTEEEIANDILAKLRADPESLKLWLDPVSWNSPFNEEGRPDPLAPKTAGSLMFMGMQIRNWYGLWHNECPFTENRAGKLGIKDGIITDPRHPDNLSMRVIQRVRAQIEAEHSKGAT